MAQDCDEVIMLINHFMEKADRGGNPVPKGETHSDGQRIKVNDKTATGGWW